VKVLKNTIALASFVGLILPAVISRQVSDPAFLQPSRVLQMDPPDSLRKDSLLFPFEDLKPYQLPSSYTPPLYLANPKNYKDSVVYDPVRDEYTIYQKIGSLNYRQPITLSSKEYLEYDFEKSLQAYWREQAAGAKHNKDISSLFSINLPFLKEESPFGSNTIDIRPSGSAELIFGVNSNRRDDPALSVKQRRTTNFDFQEKIQMNVKAKIGDKIDFGIKWNTEANFDFENKVKLKYEGKEDEIIKLIEAGDVSLPLNSTLISGSQALFGIKTKLQFGKLTMTNVFSQQKSQTNNITITGGAQVNKFELYADEYEEKKHFLLAQYFRKNYSKWLKTLPMVSSPIKITKIEVWVTNIGPVTQENRNIVAFMDLGEVEPYNHILTPTPGGYLPSNKSNNLLTYINPNQIRDVNNVSSYLQNAGFIGGVDYEKIENARLLSPTEYTVNTQLGFISLNTKLNDDQALAVAFQYTVVGSDSVYQVGEFSNSGIDAPKCLIVKLIKGTSTNTKIPLWNLMMKNVYFIGGYQINPQDFRLDVLYKSDKLGVPVGYIPEGQWEGIPLIRLLNLDKLNTNNDPEPDGIFDFLDNAATQGGTINSKNGRIYFPVLEPFGKDLREILNDPVLADRYCYDSLYTMTKAGARQFPQKNRFIIAGSYKSSVGKEIMLNATNIPPGSVKVTAGGVLLTENVDYTVDYNLGRLTILNEGILNSGAPINIIVESQSMLSFQTKTFMGTHWDYEVNKNLLLGGTLLNLTERPYTYKVNIGEEPISNTVWGLNYSYQTESQLITKLVDALPFFSTKTPSKINIQGEVANLIPGHARAIGKTGTAYIDDFEGTKSSFDLKSVGTWKLASIPQFQPQWFPEASDDSTLRSGFNRAKLCWYVIDPLFWRNNNLTPVHIRNDKEMRSNHYMREVLETEVFPSKENPNGVVMNIPTLDLAFYPSLKGPYNFDVTATPISAGIDAEGKLLEPQTRWGGIMRKIDAPDFEETNIEYIEFWLLDPFIYEPNHSGGKLVFNLGDISEDILRDHRKSYENGLPTGPTVVNVDTTQWGRVPTIQALVNAFDNNPESRKYQDVGLDGLSNEEERSFFQAYLNAIATNFTTASAAYAQALADPASDDYHYFRGSDYDDQKLSILKRYMKYNGLEGNSPTSELSPEPYPTSATTLPDVEDINRDNTLNENERYYQYVINLKPDEMQIGKNFITDIRNATVHLPNGKTETVKWYQFKIPIRAYQQVFGNISDFKSIRFMRIFLREFKDPIVLRFATLNLVRNQWRLYDRSLLYPGEYLAGDDQNQTHVEVSAVSYEENGNRLPIPYVLPPGIEREIGWGGNTSYRMNEQALVLKACHLIDGDARAVYKTANLDIRLYKKLKMFIHSELADPNNYTLNDGDVTVFIRLGTDFTDNYYEYEIPLHPTPLNVNPQDPAIRDLVWKDSLDLSLEKLVELKKHRNTLIRAGAANVSTTLPYSEMDGPNKMTIMGVPNLSDVRTIMIGIRNPKRSPTNLNDDGQPKCVEVWVNELRLTDFDEKGGWAATTQVSTNLADLGNVAIVGNVSTAGFGSIDKKISERQKDNIFSYDVSTSLELGKLLPPKAKIKLPMHWDYSETFANPQYNPLDPDVYLRDDLQTYSSKHDRDSVKKIVQDYTRIKSINFVNVQKEKTTQKSHLYDISNFSVTYAYNEIFHRNIDVEYNFKKQYRGALNYNYNTNPKVYEPFKKVKFLKPKPFKIIRDFNFSLMPSSLSFMTEMQRQYEENKWRNKTDYIISIEPNYIKNFVWNRSYALKHKLTKNLTLDYNANANARIDEPPGRIDKRDSDYRMKMDSIWQNIKGLGRITNFTQSLKVNYNLPISKLPLLDFLNTSTQYQGNYRWQGAPLYKDSLGRYVPYPLGNIIENNRSITLNASANMTTLYNKIPYFKKLQQKNKPTPQIKPSKPANQANNKNQDSTEKDTIPLLVKIRDAFFSTLLIVKNISLNYTLGEGTTIPGYMGTVDVFGMYLQKQAPGWGFVFGDQKPVHERLARLGLISTDTLLTTPLARRYKDNLNFRLSAEPVANLKIDISALRNYSKDRTSFYRYDGTAFREFTPQEMGNFSMSIITWRTAFAKNDKNFSNNNFVRFLSIREEIAKEVASRSPNWNGNYVLDSTTGKLYPDGYGSTSQQVLIPAFIAAYSGQITKKWIYDLFPKVPMPNWRITYNGLRNIKALKKYIKSANITHSYKSTYTIGSFKSNILFKDPDGDGFTTVRDALGNYLAPYELQQVNITEQFMPFLGLDVTWVNSLTTKIEYRKSRNISMTLSNNQITELLSSEFILGGGYKIKDVEFQINNKNFKSDLTLKLDLSIKDNKTILRKIVENFNQVSAGQRVFTLNISAEYQLSQKITLRAFFDKVLNYPYVSSQFINGSTNAGISVRFTLAQ